MIIAHGTSTPLNDVTETRAIKAAFGEAAYRVAVTSPKSMVGHLIGGAGAVSVIAAISAIRDQRIPPTINLDNADPTATSTTCRTPRGTRASSRRWSTASGSAARTRW